MTEMKLHLPLSESKVCLEYFQQPLKQCFISGSFSFISQDIRAEDFVNSLFLARNGLCFKGCK